MAQLDQQRRDQVSANETRYFMLATNAVHWNILARNGYTISWDVTDEYAIIKVQAIDQAVTAITGAGFDLPNGLHIYCTKRIEAQNRMFGRDANWGGICRIVLGPKAAIGGETASLSTRQLSGIAKAKCSCIHEIGHKLHELSIGDEEFYGRQSILEGNAATAARVSPYATRNKKEFVAEVFAAMILGIELPPEVRHEYAALHGPLPNDF